MYITIYSLDLPNFNMFQKVYRADENISLGNKTLNEYRDTIQQQLKNGDPLKV